MLTYEFFQHIAPKIPIGAIIGDRMSIIVLRTKDVRLHSATPKLPLARKCKRNVGGEIAIVL